MQGFNMGRYVPPEIEGTSAANPHRKAHPLGSRASKLASHGVLTVRFEMPFPVWCTTCDPSGGLTVPIGQGVRFNAEKKKVGNYYSTPVWSFRMRHPPCGGWIEIRTDPKNTAYVVVSGAQKRDTGDDKAVEGDQVILTEGEREALRRNAFAKLERTIDDREQLRRASARIDDLEDDSRRKWADPYERNRALRAAFRVGRKEREREAGRTEDLRDRMGLGIDLLPEDALDAQRASLVDFGDPDSGDQALAKPLFGRREAEDLKKTRAPTQKREGQAGKRRQEFVSEIMGNTRAITDPFLQAKPAEGRTKAAKLTGVKRKAPHEDASEAKEAADAQVGDVGSRLVDYDSD